MTNKCLNCGRFIPTKDRFCDKDCSNIFREKSFYPAKLKMIQYGHSPSLPKEWYRIIRSQKHRKLQYHFWKGKICSVCNKFANNGIVKQHKVICIKCLRKKDTPLTKKRYSSIVEQVATFYSYVKPISIPSYEREDIQQEIRLHCWIIYDKNTYPDQCTDKHLYNFLKVAVHNKLYNMQRGWRYPNNPPCVRCPSNDKKRRSCITIGGPKGCHKHKKYWGLLKTKYFLKNPLCRGIVVIDSNVKRIAYNYSYNNTLG